MPHAFAIQMNEITPITQKFLSSKKQPEYGEKVVNFAVWNLTKIVDRILLSEASSRMQNLTKEAFVIRGKSTLMMENVERAQKWEMVCDSKRLVKQKSRVCKFPYKLIDS